MSTSDRLATNLRDALGLGQEQMGCLLGVNLRTVARLEAAEGSADALSGGLGAAVLLLGHSALSRLPSTLAELAASLGPAQAKMLADIACVALQRVVDLLPKARRSTVWERLTLGELLEAAWGGGRPWVYWATSEGTSSARTRELADENEIIARSVSRNGEDVLPYLFKLRPADQVLICHDGRPLSWYRLREAEVPPKLQGARSDDDRKLPPIFRVIKPSSPLGKQLAADRYPRLDGTLDAATPFTALSVERLVTSPYAEPPVPRERGDRFTMTPYFKSGA